MCASQSSPRALTKPLTKKMSDIRKKFCRHDAAPLARTVAQLFVVRNKACTHAAFKTIGNNYAMLVAH